jgi:hypothetical protein
LEPKPLKISLIAGGIEFHRIACQSRAMKSELSVMVLRQRLERFRLNAEQAFNLAKYAKDPETQVAYTAIANSWSLLASDAEAMISEAGSE